MMLQKMLEGTPGEKPLQRVSMCAPSTPTAQDLPGLPQHPKGTLRLEAQAAAAAYPALRAALSAVLAELQAEQRAHAVTAAAAAELECSLVEAGNRADSLEVVNRGLLEQLDAAKSEVPHKDLAYEQLKDSFFHLQRKYAAVAAQLEHSRRQVADLQVQLAAATATLAAQRQVQCTCTGSTEDLQQ